jgi:hypothetical protein
LRFYLLLIAINLPFFEAKARIFRLTNETVAAYFGGSYGPSSILQTHYSGTSGTGATIDKSMSTNYGGEIGALFTTQALGVRIGFELIKPSTVTKAIGSDASSTKLYDFESSLSVLVPKVALEINLKTTETWRLFVSLGGGTATASYKNSYLFTAAGLTAFPGVADFSDEATGTALLYDGGLGFETLMNDTTTVALNIGYRQLYIPQYKYKLAVTNFTGGHAKDDVVLNEDATVKSSLFTGATAFLMFRFYLGK